MDQTVSGHTTLFWQRAIEVNMRWYQFNRRGCRANALIVGLLCEVFVQIAQRFNFAFPSNLNRQRGINRQQG